MAGSKQKPVETWSFDTILLGGTGAVVSTLLNTLVNFFSGAPGPEPLSLPAVARRDVVFGGH